MPSASGAAVRSTPAAARLEALRASIAPQRDELLAHPLYANVSTLPRLREFMRHHVFAVWDFMCLAKRLQRDLTSLDLLWLPPSRPRLARFINSIVLAEESDVDSDHRAASHFDLSLGAMEEAGAPTADVRRFIALLRERGDLGEGLRACAPPAARAFVSRTVDTAAAGATVEVLASFLFGREDLIPEMFVRLQSQWPASSPARRFAYYVARHIELDGGDHGPAGLRALAALAGDDDGRWAAARDAAASAIAARLALWNAVNEEVLRWP